MSEKTEEQYEEQYEDTEETTPPPNDTQTQKKEETLDVRKAITRVEQTLHDVDDDVKLEVVKENPDSPLFCGKEFTDFGLSQSILEGVYAMNYNRPSKIQGLAIPAIISNPPQNFIGQAQSGTGKTAAFILSILARVDQSKSETQALCVAPTRELARQIYDVAVKLAHFTTVKISLAIPEERGAQVPRKFTEHLVIGTPGKIFEHLCKGRIPTINLRMLILDEADEMLDVQGGRDQTVKIRRKLPKECQVCLFSATYNDEVKRFAQGIVPSPKTSILIPQEKLTLDALTQLYINCYSEDHKNSVLDEIYAFVDVGQSIIFTASRVKANAVYNYMKAKGHEVSLLHGGDMPPTTRDQVIDDFRKGIHRVLVTTNLLSRGVDVLQVSLVINFDVPTLPGGKPDPESYLHRIGRSGRYGKSGLAINFVHDDRSRKHLEDISNYFQKPVDELKLNEMEKVGELMEKMVTHYTKHDKK